MSRPKLPSEMHPDHPKATQRVNSWGIIEVTPARFEDLRAFYLAHPEFAKEGEYEFQCPYCGRKLEEERNYCCKEAGHGEWVLILPDDEEPLSNDTPKQAAEWTRGALEAGIPLSVIEGQSTLSDHFSESYINDQCNRKPEEDES